MMHTFTEMVSKYIDDEATVKELVQDIMFEVEDMMGEAKSDGYDEGYDDGYEQGTWFTQDDYADLHYDDDDLEDAYEAGYKAGYEEGGY